MVRLQRVRAGIDEGDGEGQGVLQLAHVARPRVRAKGGERRIRDAQVAASEIDEETLNELGEVIEPLAQGAAR